MEKPPIGWRRWLRAFQYSNQGFQAAWKNEAAFREEIIIAIFLIPLSFWLGKSSVDIALLIGTILLVIIVELLNSAIEAVVDLVSPDFNLLAGRAKDMGSAAVLIALIIAVLTWFLILWHNFS